MFEVGRLVIKLAGRDAGQTGIVVKKIDENNVLIDGNVRRRKCNIKHLQPLKDVLKIKENASTAEVHKIMSAAGIKIIEKKKVKRSEKKKVEETKTTKKKKASTKK